MGFGHWEESHSPSGPHRPRLEPGFQVTFGGLKGFKGEFRRDFRMGLLCGAIERGLGGVWRGFTGVLEGGFNGVDGF